MSLKSLINALFKLSGSQAMPKTEFTETHNLPYTAPAAGWVIVRFLTTANELPWYAIVVNGTYFFNVVGANLKNGGSCGYVPVKKGDVITTVENEDSVSLENLRFFPTVGGGGLKLISELLSAAFSEEVQYV